MNKFTVAMYEWLAWHPGYQVCVKFEVGPGSRLIGKDLPWRAYILTLERATAHGVQMPNIGDGYGASANDAIDALAKRVDDSRKRLMGYR